MFIAVSTVHCQAQIPTSQFTANQPPNYLSKSAAFRQEIARMEILVERAGKPTLPITNVPRIQKDDVIKIRLLDEPVNGIKPDQSYWDWTLLVAFVNPSRRQTNDAGDKQKSVSEEIRFRKSGWYKQYSFVVPYDSQPVFFLYPKPNYRGKILKLLEKKYEDIQKLGDKTIELAGAYAQVSSFLNELQSVLVQTQMSRYGQFATYPENSYLYNNGRGIPINPNYYGNNPLNQNAPFYNYSALVEQTVERLAQSFNIQLPQCWNTLNGNLNGNRGYNLYNNQSDFGYAVSSDLIGRAQCVAKNVRLEDFDFSVGQLLKQGGIFAATQLRDKYPQLAYWINIAALALDFIVKAFQKSPLKIVPTIVSANGNFLNNNAPNNSTGNSPGNSINNSQQNPVKISLFAESQPTDQGFVSAYPIIIQKWQSDSDPETITLPAPVLLDPCLHAGLNILKNTDLRQDILADPLSKDFKLVVSSANNYRKEFPLKKNLGMGGWELNLTKEDINSFPKDQPVISVDAVVTGIRGFNEIKSPSFKLPPIANAGTYEITPESQKSFTVGGKRTIILKNSAGTCRCLQSVTYKYSSANGNNTQLVFEAEAKEAKNQLRFSLDGSLVSFDIDTINLQPGAGVLELKFYGGEQISLNINLVSLPVATVND